MRPLWIRTPIRKNSVNFCSDVRQSTDAFDATLKAHLPCRSRARNFVAVGQGLQESDKIILLLICQLKVAELFLVEVARVFWWRPTRDLFAGVSSLAPGQNVARVVEMHYLFEALEVAVVHVGLHEVGCRTHVDIAQRGYLELCVEFGSEPDPLRIRIQLAAIALQSAQK